MALTCDICSLQPTCESLCSEMQGVLDKDSKTFYTSHFFEFPYQDYILEHVSAQSKLKGKSDYVLPFYFDDDFRSRLYDVMAKYLKPKFYNIIIDKFFNNLTQTVIGKKYGMTQQAVHYYLKTAIGILKKHKDELKDDSISDQS